MTAARQRKRLPANLANDWRAFVGAVSDRLAAGAAAYGDRNLGGEPVALAGEVSEELEDVCGWSFVLWRRLRLLRGRLASTEKMVVQSGAARVTRRRPR